MRIRLLLLVLASLGLWSCQTDENWQNSMYITGGARQLNSSDWQPLETQPMIGLEGVGRVPDGVFGVEFGGAVSYREGDVALGQVQGDIDATVFDLYLGPRLTFGGDGPLLPFLSAGFAWGYSKASSGALDFSEENSTNSAGAYARAGIDFMVSDHLSLGVDLRYVFATQFTADDGTTYDANGPVAAFRVGWTF